MMKHPSLTHQTVKHDFLQIDLEAITVIIYRPGMAQCRVVILKSKRPSFTRLILLHFMHGLYLWHLVFLTLCDLCTCTYFTTFLK